tara:strand:+ start:20 stop:958 length:939 start_codon:yes stop_codon:yes gene_type:complete
MHILVTGGAGFIGSAVSESLVNRGYKLTIVDDLSSGSLNNLIGIDSKYSFIKKGIEDLNSEDLKGIDAIIHLAAQISVQNSIDKFYTSSRSNLLGAIKVIHLCSVLKIPLIYASSAAIYGNLEFGDDESSLINPLSPYAVDKYSIELYAEMAYRIMGLSSIGLRFFNIYGPRQNPLNTYSGVISKFLFNLLNEENLVVNGGNQTRDFVYVYDAANVIVLSLEKVLKEKVNDVINVLTGRSVSINWLADHLIDNHGRSLRKIFKPLPLGDPEKSTGNRRKLLGVLKKDYKFTDVEEGLIKTKEYIIDEIKETK